MPSIIRVLRITETINPMTCFGIEKEWRVTGDVIGWDTDKHALDCPEWNEAERKIRITGYITEERADRWLNDRDKLYPYESIHFGYF